MGAAGGAAAVADESSGSEGFCDQEPRGAGVADLPENENLERDSDWSDEGIKVRQFSPQILPCRLHIVHEIIILSCQSSLFQ